MIIYITIVVFGLFKIGLWESNQLKNTIIWAISVGTLSLFKINLIRKDPHFFKNSVLDNFKLIAIVQFVVGVYTFSFLVELLLIPVLGILGAMLALSQTDEKYHLVKKILNGIITTLSAIFIFYSIYMLSTNFGEFAKVFIKLKLHIKESKVQHFAKIYSMIKFHFRINLLERWVSTLPFQDTSSKEGIKISIKQIFKMVSIEKDPPKIPLREGWSPYAAKQFLLNEGLETGYYHPTVPEEWFASSSLIELGNDIIPNEISYCVDGNESIVKSLKIILSVYSRESAIIAHSKLLSCVRTLMKAALDLDVSSDMEVAIMKGKNQVFKFDYFMVTIEKNDWPKNRISWYDLKFILSKI
jgi:hypothetical protein